jgi:hypothetical protein
MGSFFLTVFVRILSETLRCRRLPSNMIVAPLAMYLLFNILNFFKGSPLDQDPGNIFFWLLLGVVLGFRRSAAKPVTAFEQLGAVEALRAGPAE